MEIAVVYYSAQGNCALAAKALAGKLGAQLVELQEAKKRNMAGSGFMGAAFQAVFGLKSKLVGEPWKTVAGCKELHLITPIWASKLVPAVNAFVSKMDFSGKKVTLYTVQADPNDTAAKARDALAQRIRGKGGDVVGSHGLTGSAPNKEPNSALAEGICKF